MSQKIGELRGIEYVIFQIFPYLLLFAIQIFTPSMDMPKRESSPKFYNLRQQLSQKALKRVAQIRRKEISVSPATLLNAKK